METEQEILVSGRDMHFVAQIHKSGAQHFEPLGLGDTKERWLVRWTDKFKFVRHTSFELKVRGVGGRGIGLDRWLLHMQSCDFGVSFTAFLFQ